MAELDARARQAALGLINRLGTDVVIESNVSGGDIDMTTGDPVTGVPLVGTVKASPPVPVEVGERGRGGDGQMALGVGDVVFYVAARAIESHASLTGIETGWTISHNGKRRTVIVVIEHWSGDQLALYEVVARS